ncbi:MULTISPECIES: AraC family transcriptional regulator [unclassified Azospirillum]|uniref:helix-turn-helix transcriptional regulator n=1 Tax=unclassified Azospirillum TaxID=2630922 RepID=UPI001178C76F|nr:MULTISPECIES: helix-turn-helix domain-containing protein [unclassified Azospirillum]
MDQTWLIGDGVAPSLCGLMLATGRLDGRLENLGLRPGLSVTLLDFTAATAAEIAPNPPAGDTGGACHLLALVQGQVLLTQGGGNGPLPAGHLHHLPHQGDGPLLSVCAGEAVRGAMLHIDAPLMRTLGADAAQGLDSRPAGNQCLRVVDRMLETTSEAPPLRDVMLHAKGLEYLALAMAELQQPAIDHHGLSRREQAQIMAAHGMLLADLAKPPSLRQLAGAAGLNEKRLNEGFRALYGATVFECLRNARLEKGRQLLFDDQLPLKTIAWQVGYTHVNNFITAYRNHFGEPPRRHQNGGAEE